MIAVYGIVAAAYAGFIGWTHPKLEYDALIFWNYAHTFQNDGLWQALRQTAPSREPGYPLFLFVIGYLFPARYVLKGIILVQYGLLWMTAWMVFEMAKRLIEARPWAIAVFVAVALSPALVTTAQTLYAETVGGFLFVAWLFALWRWLDQNTTRLTAFFFLSALAGSALILTRPVYLHVSLFCIVITCLMILMSRQSAHSVSSRLGKVFLYSIILLTPPALWMIRNQEAYGVFNLADHAAVVLKGRYEKSREHYSMRDVAAGTLNAVSESACRVIFHDCGRYYWEYANGLGYRAMQELENNRGFSEAQASQILFRQTVCDVLRHPIRFFAFGGFEIVQLAFFETMGTGASTVDAGWMQAIQSNTAIRGVIHVGLSGFYLAGCISLLVFVMWRKLAWESSQWRLFALCAVPLSGHFFVYSMATTVIRYSFIIAPVYILLALTGWRQWFCKSAPPRGPGF